MRICLVSQEYPPETGWGGIGTQTVHKARGLAARGHDVHVVSSTWGADAKRTEEDGVVVHRLPVPNLSSLGNNGPAFQLAYSLDVARTLSRLTDDVGFDIIQFAEYGAEGFVFQTETFEHRKARYVVQLHSPIAMFARHLGWPDLDGSHFRIARFMEAAILDHADALLSSSHNTAAFAAGEYGLDAASIEVVHSAVDTDLFAPVPGPDGDPGPRILFVGRLTDLKGFFDLLDSVVRMRAYYPGIRLRAVGKARPEKLELLAQVLDRARAHDMFELIENTPLDALPEHYAWCDFLVGPSIYEGGPGNTYLEAMSCGKPVVACQAGGAKEVVLEGSTGLLVPAKKPTMLDAAIDRLASDPSQAAHMGATARARVVNNFSLATYLDKIESVYRKISG